MPSDEEEDTTVYTVVINHEEQYSIWPKHKAIPQGWKAVGKEGLKPECLHYVDKVWTDMRPLSLRKKWKGSPNTVQMSLLRSRWSIGRPPQSLTGLDVCCAQSHPKNPMRVAQSPGRRSGQQCSSFRRWCYLIL